MTLEEKLEMIDKLIQEAEIKHKAEHPDVPFDPATVTICDGCE